MEIILSFFPVLLFLGFLFMLDNFRLVRISSLLLCLLWGIIAAGAGSQVNTFLAGKMNLDFEYLSRYVAPVTEEILKALAIVVMIYKRKQGFLVDAAIYGFATGAGFSLAENIMYLLSSPPESALINSVIRGFGTAFMHGGCTGLLAVIFMAGIGRSGSFLLSGLAGLLAAVLIHSGFNHFPLPPLYQTLVNMILMPLLFVLIFRINTQRLQKWLEIEFSSEVELLGMIRRGEFGTTKSGKYLASLRAEFQPEVVFDMYCFLSLYIELSIKAKRNIMLQEGGFPPVREEDILTKLEELRVLRRRIGKIGELALAPLIRMNYRNLWKLTKLKAG